MRRLLLLSSLVLLAPAAGADPLALAYALEPGAVVVEDFDGMGADGSLAPGALRDGSKKKPRWDSYWSVTVAAAKPPERYDALAAPELLDPAGYNAGAAGAGDRALGIHAPLASTRALTARFRNDTGAPLEAFELRFDAEFWSEGPAGSWGSVQALASADGASWVDLGADFGALRASGGASAEGAWLDGNAPANSVRGLGGRVELAALGLAPLAAGADLYLRFEGAGGWSTPPPPGSGNGRGKQAGNPAREGVGAGFFVDNLQVAALAAADAPPVPSLGRPGLAALALALFALAAQQQRGRS
jgi:hypothetical protein